VLTPLLKPLLHVFRNVTVPRLSLSLVSFAGFSSPYSVMQGRCPFLPHGGGLEVYAPRGKMEGLSTRVHQHDRGGEWQTMKVEVSYM
jgi:hypothetical protein